MKKLVSMGIGIMMLFMTCCYATEDYFQGFDDGYQAGLSDSKEKIPVVQFVEPEDIPEVAAGDKLNLTIEFRNNSSYPAKDLVITPVLEDTPLVYERPLSYKMVKSLQANKTGTASFSIPVSENAKVGTYALKFKVEYKNSRDETFSREEVTYYQITSEKLKPILTISNIKNSLETIRPGDTFQIEFMLNNIGGSDAEDVEVTLEGFHQNGIMPVDSNDYTYIGTIAPKQVKTQSFWLIASKDITNDTHVITVTITYHDATGNESTLSKSIYLANIESEKEEEESGDSMARPKVIIFSYGVNPSDVVAGDTFTLNFSFRNTSKEKRIRNMKITVSSEEGAFIITRGSNTFYIEEMNCDEIMTKAIELKAKQDLASNSYKVILEFDYEDFSGNQYTATENLNIPVTEYSKLVINSVYAGEAYVNATTNLSFDYVNMGRATVSNLTARVEGDYTCAQEINYIGNLTAGTSDYFDIEVIPSKEGVNYGVLILAFEDSSGGTIEVRKEFEGTAFAENFFEPGGDDPMMGGDVFEPTVEPEPEIATWVYIVSGIGTFLVSLLVAKMITAKIIRKRLEDEL